MIKYKIYLSKKKYSSTRKGIILILILNCLDVLGIRSDLLCSAGRVALNISADYDKHELTRDGYLRSAISDHGDYCFETFDSRQCPGGDLTVTAVTCFVKPQMKNFQVSFLVRIINYCSTFVFDSHLLSIHN